MARHKPKRTCIVCREVKDKQNLVRIVRTPAGQVIVDSTGKANGRGAYLCRQSDCWERGLKKERVAQALKVVLSSDEATTLYESLQTELSKV